MPVAQLKALKPKGIKEGPVRLELLNGLRRAGKAMQKDFEKTVETWDKKPKFEIKISLSQGTPSVSVSTNDEIYGYVNDGTKPHIITPVKAKALVFMGGYRAKTSPGVIGSSGGGADGDLIHTQIVHHPGTEPRDFAKQIAAIWQDKFADFLSDAMERAAQKMKG